MGLTVWRLGNRKEIPIRKATTVESSGADGPYRRFVLPEIEDWELRLIVAD